VNERIQELAKELGPVATIGNWGRVEWADNVYPQLGDKMYASIDLEKFAELIIQECFQACMNEGASYEEKSAGAYQSNLYVTAIKKHFGVEE